MLKVGDRVRIIAGPWASDCGTVIRVRRGTIVVKLDTMGKRAVVRVEHVVKIS